MQKKKGNDRRYLEQRAVVRGHIVQLVVKNGIHAKNKKNIFSRSGTGTKRKQQLYKTVSINTVDLAVLF